MTQNPFSKIGQEIGDLVQEKQAAYGDSFGKAGRIMDILYPAGVPPEQIDDALTIVRIIDKLFRIATSKDALGESPYRDIAGYALLAIRRDETDYSESCEVDPNQIYPESIKPKGAIDNGDGSYTVQAVRSNW